MSAALKWNLLSVEEYLRLPTTSLETPLAIPFTGQDLGAAYPFLPRGCSTRP
jgi:hypothetical protein